MAGWHRGAFRDTDPAVFEIRDDYFTTRTFAVIEQRANLKMHFAGWSRPLRDYTQAVEDAGLFITALREPCRRHLNFDPLAAGEN